MLYDQDFRIGTRDGRLCRCKHGNHAYKPCVRCGLYHPIKFLYHSELVHRSSNKTLMRLWAWIAWNLIGRPARYRISGSPASEEQNQ